MQEDSTELEKILQKLLEENKELQVWKSISCRFYPLPFHWMKEVLANIGSSIAQGRAEM